MAPPLRVDEQHAVARARTGAPLPYLPSFTGTTVAFSRRRQNAHTSPGVGAPHTVHARELVALDVGVGREPLVAALEEAEQERGLRARRAVLEGVEHLLEPEVAVARRHRALLDLVVDPAQHAVGRGLPLAEPDERLHLAGEAGRGGQHRVLAAEVRGLPAQHVAEQHRGFVVEVVAGGDDVVAVFERGGVEEVALRQAARTAGRAAGGRGGAGDVVAVVAARSISMSGRPMARACSRAYVTDSSEYSPMPSPR